MFCQLHAHRLVSQTGLIFIISFSLMVFAQEPDRALLAPFARTDYRVLHHSALVADGHNDTVGRILDEGVDISKRLADGNLDIPRMKEGGLDLSFFAAWVDPRYMTAATDQSAERVHAMIDALEKLVAAHPGEVGFAKNTREAGRLVSENKIAIAMGIEGGHAIENSLDELERFAKRGIRYMTLTWNNSLTWATSGKDEAERKDLKFRGLTPFGRQVVRKMNELGVMVDVSHVGVQTFWDVMVTTRKPVIASHSSVYALCPHFRNLRDEQIKAVAKNGGVILINFYAGFLDSTYEKRVEEFRHSHQDLFANLRRQAMDDHGVINERKYGQLIQEKAGDELNALRPPLSVLIDHLEYIAKLVGPEYVGLGSDFDGLSALPKDLDDVSKLPLITKALQERGWGDEAIKKILGGNLLRVWKANEK
ncbi:MAG: dipeptidase [candidate division KSB1 bacterium]|nr:dipeptidase [candidate division KSB1 bacterium]MDZ7303812.1 dipeptidase [candidate division KSB1 bacterium]MDZ7314177.1 dipeptidase [candidate division KSB1 bacterium]